MVPKRRQFHRIAAVALALGAVGCAIAPAASAVDYQPNFGVKSVYTDTPSIVGFRGYFHSSGSAPGGSESPSDPTPGTGSGGDGTDPGTGTPGADPGTGNPGTDPSGEPYTPGSCTLTSTISSDFTQTGTMDGTNYLSPREFGSTSSDNPYGYSKWIDQAMASDAVITVGQPKVFLPDVQVDTYDPATNSYAETQSYQNVSFDEFDPYIGSAKAVPAGTINPAKFPSFYKGEKRAAANFGSIQISGMDTSKVPDLVNSPSFWAKVNAPFPSDSPAPGDKQYSVNSNLMVVDYPVSVQWPAGSEYAGCSTTTDAAYTFAFGAA